MNEKSLQYNSKYSLNSCIFLEKTTTTTTRWICWKQSKSVCPLWVLPQINPGKNIHLIGKLYQFFCCLTLVPFRIVYICFIRSPTLQNTWNPYTWLLPPSSLISYLRLCFLTCRKYLNTFNFGIALLKKVNIQLFYLNKFKTCMY